MNELMPELVQVLGRALLHFLWQGALIGLLAAVALQCLRNARPQTRYAVACIALLACLLVPLASVVAQLGQSTVAESPMLLSAAGVTSFETTAAAPMMQIETWSPRIEDSLPWIVAMWAAGACALSLRMAMGVAWIRRLRATPQGPMQAAWQARLDALCQRFGIRRLVALQLVDAIDSPASAGWWRPVVLLPTALLTRMPTDLIEALLAHELAHIRRHDYLVNLLQGVVEALLFYHPVTWWLSRRIRDEREHIADRLAAEATGEPRRLALALSELSDLLSQSHPQPSFHLAQAAHGGHLMSRIEQLVRPARSRDGRLAFPLIGLAAACVAFYAHAQITKPEVVTPAVQATPAAKATSAAAAQPAAQAKTANAAQPAAKAVTVRDSSTIRLSDDKAPRQAYGLVRKGQDGFTMHGSSKDIDAIRNAQRSLSDDFLWFRRDDKAYVVVDPSIVSRAHSAWRETDKLSAQMDALGDQMEVHGDKMEALGEQMEKLSTQYTSSAAMEEISKRMDALGQQQTKLSEQQVKVTAALVKADQAQYKELERQMEALADQQEAIGRQFEHEGELMDAEARRMDKQSEPMDALSRQMDEASKPMDALGKQMDALGEQMDKLSDQAERETQKLIDEALAKGLALPAPGRTRQ